MRHGRVWQEEFLAHLEEQLHCLGFRADHHVPQSSDDNGTPHILDVELVRLGSDVKQVVQLLIVDLQVLNGDLDMYGDMIINLKSSQLPHT